MVWMHPFHPFSNLVHEVCMKVKKEETTAPETVEGAMSMDSLTAGESLPEVNQAAVDAVKASEAEEAAAAKKLAESAPYGLKKDGTPAKKRGKQKQTATPSHTPLNLSGVAPVERKSLPAAITVSALLEQMQVAMISPEFKYTELEQKGNIEAWEKTFDHYGGVKIHPAVELAMSHASIIATRASQGKETQTKLAHFKVWLSSKFKRKDKKDALSSDRKDSERENDIRGKENEGNL